MKVDVSSDRNVHVHILPLLHSFILLPLYAFLLTTESTYPCASKRKSQLNIGSIYTCASPEKVHLQSLRRPFPFFPRVLAVSFVFLLIHFHSLCRIVRRQWDKLKTSTREAGTLLRGSQDYISAAFPYRIASPIMPLDRLLEVLHSGVHSMAYKAAC